MNNHTTPSTAPAAVSLDERVAELALQVPEPFPPAGSYINAVRTGNLLVLGGHVPIDTEGRIVVGKLGADLDLTAGRHAARLAALSAVSTLRETLGAGEQVRRIVSLRGVVNATPEFVGHTQVIDAASEVFIALFGAAGQHARLAVGVASLPANLALEIELLVEVDQ